MRNGLLALLLVFLATTEARTEVGPLPNIVFILADDLGWTDLSCQGSGYYLTPHIDRLASQGLRLTSAYSCGPNCQPTRAALMSGQYGPRTGVYTVGGIDRFDWKSRPLKPVENRVKLPLETVTLAQSLQNAGYVTGMFGKWHLGEDPKHHPSRRGFDEAIVSMGQHFDFETNPKVDYPKGTYLADFLTQKSTDFISRNKGKPFFLYLPHFGVHSPHDAKKGWIEKFRDRPPLGGHKDPVYAAMIASVDESVGKILDHLDKENLSRNTLVIFSSDNGGVGGYIREGIRKGGGDITDNAPLRSGKGSLYEGGIRVPMIVRWPGKVPVGVSPLPFISVDLYPTLLEIAGKSRSTGGPLDGKSQLTSWRSGGKTPIDRSALYWHFPGYLGAGPGQWRTTPAGAIRKGDYKLIEFFEDHRLELYNLAQDLGETKNLAKELPEVTKDLSDQLAWWRKEIKAPMPTTNQEFRGVPKK